MDLYHLYLEKVLSKGYFTINRCSTFCEILSGLLPKELSGCIPILCSHR